MDLRSPVHISCCKDWPAVPYGPDLLRVSFGWDDCIDDHPAKQHWGQSRWSLHCFVSFLKLLPR